LCSELSTTVLNIREVPAFREDLDQDIPKLESKVAELLNSLDQLEQFDRLDAKMRAVNEREKGYNSMAILRALMDKVLIASVVNIFGGRENTDHPLWTVFSLICMAVKKDTTTAKHVVPLKLFQAILLLSNTRIFLC
jgi:hypothetical protein